MVILIVAVNQVNSKGYKRVSNYKENHDRYKGKKWLIEGFHFKDAEVHVYLIPSQSKKISLVSFS